MADAAHPPAYPSRPKWIERTFAWLLARFEGPMEVTYGELKDELFAGLHGHVVEIGPGVGINFKHYPQDIRLTGIEPNPYLRKALDQHAREAGLDATFIESVAEDMALPDDSADAVVCTLVLCSVYEPARVLAEVLRILKPGGRFYYIEHVAAADGTWLRRVQDTINPAWRYVADGCNTNRCTAHALEAAGFNAVHLTAAPLSSPYKWIEPHIYGYAVK